MKIGEAFFQRTDRSQYRNVSGLYHLIQVDQFIIEQDIEWSVVARLVTSCGINKLEIDITEKNSNWFICLYCGVRRKF